MKRKFKVKKSEILVPQELISKDRIPAHLKSRMDELVCLINEKTAALRDAPEGRLRISRQGKGNRPHYYHVTNENSNGEYIPLENMDLIKALAQKGYDQKVLKVARTQLAMLEQFNRRYQSNAIEGVWTGLYRGDLVIPAILDDDLYAERWSAVPFEGLPFDECMPSLITSDGRRVRSKSELIIAEALINMNIPFRYECPKMLGGVLVHPDFTCLNLKTRKEIIWEHFGMMDVPEYACNMVKKISMYQKNGFFAGVNFIHTMETVKHPIKPEMVKHYVENFLL